MTQRPQSIFTPRVIQARKELLSALTESVKQSNFEPEVIEGKVTAVLSEIWNEADKIARAIPLVLDDNTLPDSDCYQEIHAG
jgi:hypothetical protein